MKQSIYNTTVRIGKNDVLYNTISNRHVVLTDNIKDALACKAETPISSVLEANNFLVKDDVDEKCMVENLMLQRRYSSKIYQLTINTSLDCNLCCWYCYETHSKKTYMSIDMAKRILQHLEIKCETNPFKVLSLSFFGGEPLINYKVIEYILTEIKTLSKKYKFQISLGIVTNGTLITSKYLELFKGFEIDFQITIDGNKDNHNNTRKYKNKNTQQNSYEKIIENLKLLNSSKENFHFIIRVNYTTETLKSISTLIADIRFLDKKKTVFSLQRVWQHQATQEDVLLLMDAINYINSLGYIVDSYSLDTSFQNCYADNFNQAVINYDGSVFKCTAKDFAKERPTGKLNSMGIIEWNIPEIHQRMSLEIPNECKDCILLPSCKSICSQTKLDAENYKKITCPFENDITKDNIIRLNIKQQLIYKRDEKESNYAVDATR